MTAPVEFFRLFTRILRVGLLTAAAGGAGACGPDAPPYYYYPGGGGPCASDLDCPYGLYCVDSHGAICAVPCASSFDCGPGYACQSKKRHGAEGHLAVCVVP